jgi:hypothetical protein
MEVVLIVLPRAVVTEHSIQSFARWFDAMVEKEFNLFGLQSGQYVQMMFIMQASTIVLIY